MKVFLTMCLAVLPAAASVAQGKHVRSEAYRDGVVDLVFGVDESVSGRNSIQVWNMFQLGEKYSGYEVQAVVLRARKSERYSEAWAQANVNGYTQGSSKRFDYGLTSEQVFYVQSPAIVNQNIYQLRIDTDGPIYVESLRVRLVAPRDCRDPRDERPPCRPQPEYGYDFEGVIGGYPVSFKGETLRVLHSDCWVKLSDLGVNSSPDVWLNGTRYYVGSVLPNGRDALCSLVVFNARPRKFASLALDAVIEGVLPVKLYTSSWINWKHRPREVLEQFLDDIMPRSVHYVSVWGEKTYFSSGYGTASDLTAFFLDRIR